MTVDPSKLTPFKNIKNSSSLREISEDAFYVVNEVVTKRLGHIPILKVNIFFVISRKIRILKTFFLIIN